jgi:drug/metabolite transporter (DMT)-like permease
VALAMGERVLAPGGGGLWGEAAVLGAALCGAVCSVFYRPYLRRYPPVAVSAVAMLASVLFLGGLAGATEDIGAVARLDGAGWGAVGFIGVGSGAGYFFWLFALKHLPPTQVTVSLSLSPLTAIVLGAVLLGEPVGVGVGLGLVAIAGGMWLAARSAG